MTSSSYRPEPDLWHVALEEADRKFDPASAPVDERDAFANGAEWGAGWLAAVIGMAEAIQKKGPRLVEPDVSTKRPS